MVGYIIKRLACLVAATQLLALSAFGEEQHSPFRHAFACPDRGPASICVFGKVPQGKPVTIITKDSKTSATPREEFPDDGELGSGLDTITRLQVNKLPPKGADMIAIVAPADSVRIFPQIEVHDVGVLQRVSRYLRRIKDMDQDPDKKYSVDIRLKKLAPAILVAEANVSSFIEYIHPTTGEKE